MTTIIDRPIDRPRDDVGRTGRDQLVAAGTPIRLLSVATRYGAHVPVTVMAVLNRLAAETYPVPVKGLGVGSTTMATGTHDEKINSVDKPTR